jgi:5'-3' exonuclease
MPIIMECLAAVGVDTVGLEDYEAEDIISSLVSKVSPPVEIASGDRDLFSLIRDREVIVLYPEKTGIAEVDEAEVTRRYSIPGRAYSDFAVLRGDPSDGLPGIAGVGAKKAADLVRRYGSVAGMLEAGIFRDSDAEYLEKAPLRGGELVRAPHQSPGVDARLTSSPLAGEVPGEAGRRGLAQLMPLTKA